MQISFTCYSPAPALEGAIAHYWLLDCQVPPQDFIEPAWAGMGWLLGSEWDIAVGGLPFQKIPPAWACGPTDREARAHGSAGKVLGVMLLPWGWSQFTDLPAHPFVNCFRPMADIFGEEAPALIVELEAFPTFEALDRLDDFFLGLAASRPEPPVIVARAYAALASGEVSTVAEWAARTGLHIRQLQRLCLTHFGLPPKRLLMRDRILRAVEAMRGGEQASWSKLIDASYADQAHFVREFRQFMQVPPGAWRARPNLVDRASVARFPAA